MWSFRKVYKERGIKSTLIQSFEQSRFSTPATMIIQRAAPSIRQFPAEGNTVTAVKGGLRRSVEGVGMDEMRVGGGD